MIRETDNQTTFGRKPIYIDNTFSSFVPAEDDRQGTGSIEMHTEVLVVSILIYEFKIAKIIVNQF